MMKNKDYKINFIGVGAQKAATSWLYKCLMEHPDICGYSGKETHFFSDDNLYEKGLEFYNDFFKDCDNNKITGEISTSYLTNVFSPERIRKYLPNIKLIVCLRNPLDRAVSHINHLISKNREIKNKNIDKILRNFPEVYENGLYAKYLKNYLKLFPRENILIIFYEDIKKDPLKFIKNIYKFLNADSNFIPRILNIHYNSSKIRLSGLHRLVNKIYLKLNKRKLGKKILNFLRFIGFNSIRVNKIISIFGGKDRYCLNDKNKNKLIKKYIEDIEKLEKLINKNLDNWKNV